MRIDIELMDISSHTYFYARRHLYHVQNIFTLSRESLTCISTERTKKALK
jgi:hypothetical protein